MRRKILLVFSFVFITFLVMNNFSHISYAANRSKTNYLDFTTKSQHDNFTNTHSKSIKSLTSVSGNYDKWIPPIYNFAINLLTVLFVAAVIAMGFGIMMKAGHWQRWATSTMIFSFVTFLLLRLGPMFFLTTNTVGFTLFASDIIHFLTTVAFWAAIGMALVGAFMSLLHKIVSQHPEYYRWSKGLFTGAIILGVLSTVAPLLFRSI